MGFGANMARGAGLAPLSLVPQAPRIWAHGCTGGSFVTTQAAA